jgi:hypothetical protein
MKGIEMIGHESAVFDDGEFYFLVGHEHRPGEPTGVLMHRRESGETRLRDDFVGRVGRDTQGSWRVFPEEPNQGQLERQFMKLGSFADKSDAILMLWQRRHQAFGYLTHT